MATENLNEPDWQVGDPVEWEEGQSGRIGRGTFIGTNGNDLHNRVVSVRGGDVTLSLSLFRAGVLHRPGELHKIWLQRELASALRTIAGPGSDLTFSGNDLDILERAVLRAGWTPPATKGGI